MLLLSLAAEAACPVQRTNAELREALDEVDRTWGVDPAAFEAAIATERAMLPCMGRVVDTTLAARLHRAEGLAAFLARDLDTARRAFAAARAADEAITLPPEMAPEGGPLREAWSALPAVSYDQKLTRAEVGVGVYTDGVWRHDGRYGGGDLAPLDRPFVAQRLRDTEIVAWTVYAQSPADLPVLETEPQARAAWAWWASGGTAIAGGALLGAAYAADANYRQSTDIPTADQQREVVNGLAAASAGLGTLALGFGVVAVAGSF
ncbi:MAG: hypothetical protein FJ102_02120 [Deltaproteobacteria bacterium]|nr:hypothetical protein [Deltaproteobacteria bacterium]